MENDKTAELALRLRDVFIAFIVKGKNDDIPVLFDIEKDRIKDKIQSYIQNPELAREIGLTEEELGSIDPDTMTDQQIEDFLKNNLSKMNFDMEVFSELGMDSIEAFEAVSALHELIDKKIPEDLDPASITNFHSLAEFIHENYTQEQIDIILSPDFPERVKKHIELNTIEDDFEGEF
jgi:acyl carrier protein